MALCPICLDDAADAGCRVVGALHRIVAVLPVVLVHLVDRVRIHVPTAHPRLPALAPALSAVIVLPVR